MKLGEVTLDSHVDVAVVRGDTSVNLQSTVLGVKDDALYVRPFMHGKALVRFDIKPDMRVGMTAVRPGEVPNYWNSVSVVKGTYNNKVCHVIRSNINGVRLNRRNAARTSVGLDGICKDSSDETTYQITVRDVSSTGIGFLLTGNDVPDYKLFTPVRITYNDPEARFNVDVEGRIIRKTDVNSQTTIYGCKFKRMYPQMGKYVLQKLKNNKSKSEAV